MMIRNKYKYIRKLLAALGTFVFAYCSVVDVAEVIAQNNSYSDKTAKKSNTETNAANITANKDDDENDNSSIWDSKPEEITAVNIQVLDKTSGKVFKKKIKKNEPLKVGGIEITLKRCFKNAPEDSKEISAFVEIKEGKFMPLARWLFASSPSINLFAHPQYDVRVEF